MWDLTVSVPDHCLSFYFTGPFLFFFFVFFFALSYMYLKLMFK